MSDAFGYVELEQDVQEILREAGKAGAIIRTSGGGNDPWEEYEPGTTVTIPCTLVELQFDQKDIDGQRIRETDILVMVSTENNPAPTSADVLSFGGKEFSIISSKPLAPGPVILYWEVHARGR